MTRSIENSNILLTFELSDEEEALFSKDSGTFIDKVKNINKLPFDKGDFYWTDRVWDFSEYTNLSIPHSNMRFNFDRCCEDFRDECKAYVLILFLENRTKIQTIHIKFGELCIFFNYVNEHGFSSVTEISNNIIQEYIKNKRQNTSRTYARSMNILRLFFEYYSAHYENVYSPERKAILSMSKQKQRSLKAEQENNKLPDIPSEWFDKLLSRLIQLSNDKSYPKYMRGAACINIIMSQTGLRIGECLALMTGMLEEISIFIDTEEGRKEVTSYYFNFKAWKQVRGNNAFIVEKIYVTDIAKDAYNLLCDLYRDERKDLGTEYLFLGSDILIKANRFPITSEQYMRYYRFLYFYMDDVLHTVNTEEHNSFLKTVVPIASMKTIRPETKSIAKPHTEQFRVHVCNELYRKGVPIQYIEKFMGHLSYDMQGYYIRPKKFEKQEDYDYSYATISKIVSGELKPLGGKDPDGLVKRIQAFVEEGNYNVKTDMKAICDELLQKLPIRQKTGGVCIKSSKRRDCSIDLRTNDYYCAYGVCPNIYHFYYMAGISYRQAKELEETISINKNNGFYRQVEKETNMLRRIVVSKLDPEINELITVINKRGIDAVLRDYPDLSDIITNINSIQKEVEQWKSLK